MLDVSIRYSLAFALAAALAAPLCAQTVADDPAAKPNFPVPGQTTLADAAGTGTQNSVTAISNGVQLLFNLLPTQFGATQSAGSGCSGYTAPSGREYAVIGLNRGVGFVEITNPNAPVIVYTYLSSFASTWREVEVAGNYAYSVSEGGNGIQVFDLNNIDNGVVTHVGNVTTGGTTATHTIRADDQGHFLYRNGGGSNGLRIYDLSVSPTNPPFVGQWNTRYVHDCQVVYYTSGPYAGKQIAFCATDTGGEFLTILDVTNKSSITVIKELTYPQSGYSHQGWLSSDRTHLYLGDELDEQQYGLPSTRIIFDVTSLAGATYVGKWNNGNPAIDHNAYVKGTLLYQANYRSGFRVADITNQTAPVEVGWYDTYPANDSAQFNSLWNVFPFFPSGVVVGSDIEKGLWAFWVPNPYNKPTIYCAGKVNSLGCLPTLSYEGGAALSSPAPFWVTASNVLNNKAGIFFYGMASANTPFHGGTLCVATPIRRNMGLNSGGTPLPINDCSGIFTFDYNIYIQSGVDPALVAGATVYAQNWSRDPLSPSGDSLSNAIQFTIDQ